MSFRALEKCLWQNVKCHAPKEMFAVIILISGAVKRLFVTVKYVFTAIILFSEQLMNVSGFFPTWASIHYSVCGNTIQCAETFFGARKYLLSVRKHFCLLLFWDCRCAVIM